MSEKFINNRLTLIVLISACVVIMISMGLRQTFGLFFQAFEEGLGCTRTEFGLAIGIQMIFWGMFSPLFGLVADRFGGNKAVWNFDRSKHIKEPIDMPPKLYAGCDFNVSMMATTIFGVISDTVIVVDELYLENSNTEAMAKYIKQKYPQIKDIYPDPAGKARSTTAKNNHSDHMILKQYGFNVYARPKAPHVKQRLYDLNRLLLDADDNVRLTVSPKCEKLIRDFELCQRKPDGSLDKTLHTF